MFFQGNLAYFVPLCEVFQRVPNEGLDVVDFSWIFLEIVSPEDFPKEDWTVLFEVDVKSVQFFEQRIQNQSLFLFGSKSIVTDAFPQLSGFHLFDQAKNLFLIFV